VFLYDTDIYQLSVCANKALSDINNWFKLNKFSVYVKKCNFILFTTRPITADFKASLVFNKVSKNIGILRRIKNKKPVSLLRNLYFKLINPYFEYRNVIWAISSSIALVKLVRIQKRAIRLVANSEWNAHTAPLFRDLNILTIHQLNLLYVALFLYKVYNNLLPQYFIDMFVPNFTVHSHNTRQRDDFHVPYHRLVSTSNSIHVYGVNVWNSICKDIKNINSLKLFRIKYKYCIIQW